MNTHIYIIFLSRYPFGAQEIHSNKNNHDQFNVMETIHNICLGPQQHQSNNTKRVEFANQSFVRDTLYMFHLLSYLTRITPNSFVGDDLH